VFIRYIIFDILKLFFASLLLITVTLVLIIVVNKAMQIGVPFQHAIQLVPFVLPEALRLAIPMTLLLATTISFSRMAGSNEIIAAKALGISPWRLIWPVLIVAMIFSFLCVWLNDFAVTWGRSGLTRVIYYSLEDTIYSRLEKDGSFSQNIGNDTCEIKVERVEGKKLIHPEITLYKEQKTVKMDEAEIIVDYAKGTFSIRCVNLYGEDGTTKITAREWKSPDFPIPGQPQENRDTQSPSDIPLNNISEQIEKCLKRIDVAQKKIASMTAFSLITGDIEATSQNQPRYEAEMNSALSRYNRLHTEPNRRWANGFSCFFFVWIGIPLAIKLQRADVFSSFFICFLPILAIYYPFLMYGTDGAKSGTLPPVFVWIGNACLAIIGYWFIKQIHKN
jgi:lipopolysaccharide export system permease protein